MTNGPQDQVPVEKMSEGSGVAKRIDVVINVVIDDVQAFTLSGYHSLSPTFLSVRRHSHKVTTC
ncbi:Uncharacterised protein [Raoultella terrigena]|uniref:Uncharacterized protein n=1 Tax=Raoultella terrigena TaxID=577 RepID=A0A3P8JVM1_RAOTE|nr:Uncharacterised protein [Raoultella terrigena]